MHRLKLPFRNIRTGLACLGLAAAAFFLLLVAVPSPIDTARLWPVSPALLDNTGRLFHVRLSSREEYCLPVPLEAMGKWLPLVAVHVEDKRFFSHFGLDPLALGRAVARNLLAGRVVSGASTITSQVIRLSFPRARTVKNKIVEFAQAIKLDWSLSKNEILEIYLNRAPFGGPVRGVEAAARSYFGKRAQELSLAEAALLIGMLRGPSLYRPDRNPEKTLKRRNTILARLAGSGIVDEATLKLALLEPLPPGRSAIPGEHRHFADLVLRELPPLFWEQSAAPLPTTLNPDAQRQAELRLSEALSPLPERITAAAAIIENGTGALIAYVGNRRFTLASGRNWVDCASAPRSPGSVLKPFVYLRAIESGRIIPATMLADTPLSFAGEAPRNYDRLYRGPVAAGRALALSLNAPAVRVLRLAGGAASLHFLRTLGFSGLRRSYDHYGDSLVLGGCEITLQQLANAYATLARLGLYRPVTGIQSKAVPGSPGERRMFSAESAFLIAESLREAGRMPPMLRMALQEQNRHIAFKTGTSFGMRDAWAAAYTPRYTVAVWLGDPEGIPYAALSGLPLAAPAALRLLHGLPHLPVRHGQKLEEAPWYDPPDGLERFAACALSGMPATPACPGRAMQWRIRGVSRTSPCSIHQLQAGKAVTVLPPDLADFSAGLDRDTSTAPEKGKTNTGLRVARSSAVDITSPLPGVRYFITPHAPVQHIALNAEGTEGRVYWFVDEEFFGLQEKGEALLWPLHKGRHVVSLIDERGAMASARFRVIDILETEGEPVRFLP